MFPTDVLYDMWTAVRTDVPFVPGQAISNYWSADPLRFGAVVGWERTDPSTGWNYQAFSRCVLVWKGGDVVEVAGEAV